MRAASDNLRPIDVIDYRYHHNRLDRDRGAGKETKSKLFTYKRIQFVRGACKSYRSPTRG